MATTEKPARKHKIMQSRIPAVSLEAALRVPTAILDNYAGQPSGPIAVAQAVDMTPTSGPFRTLTGAAVAYGLTDGAYNAQTIKVTDLAKRILRPTSEGDDIRARREALLRPEVMGGFLKKYDGNRVPKDSIAQNVLCAEFGVPQERTAEVLKMILSSAQSVGVLTDIKGASFIQLNANGTAPNEARVLSSGDDLSDQGEVYTEGVTPKGQMPTESVATGAPGTSCLVDPKAKRVYITHGKNRAFLPRIKEFLNYGDLDPVISVEKESVAKPLPDKVMQDMRSCGAAIIHVDDELMGVDKEGNSSKMINPNVLVEIGAAMALFGGRFILLVKDGVSLPSNLQGLYQVRYEGDDLNGEATMKLLKAITDMKKTPLPKN